MTLSCSFLWWRLKNGGIDIAPFLSRWAPLHLPFQQPALDIHWGEVRLSLEDNRGRKSTFWEVPDDLKVNIKGLYTQNYHALYRDTRLGYVQLIVHFTPILRGAIEPISLDIENASLELRYFKNGTFGLNHLPFSSLAKKSSNKDEKPFQIRNFLQNFQEFSLKNTYFSIHNEDIDDPQKSDAIFTIDKAKFSHACHVLSCLIGQNWGGNIEGRVKMGNENIPLSFMLQTKTNEGSEQNLAFSMGGFIPSYWGDWFKRSGLEQVKFPVSLKGKAEFQFYPKFSVSDASLAVKLGEGSFMPHLGADEIHLKDGALDAKLKAEQTNLVEISVPVLHVADRLGHISSLSLKSHMMLDELSSPRHIEIALDALLPSFNFATLESIWPEGAMKGARRWITQNMTQGEGKNLHIQMRLASKKGFDDLDVKELKGDLYGENLSVTWLKPIQPVTGLFAHAFFITPDILEIDLSHGLLSDKYGKNISIPTGKVTISGMMAEDQDGDIRLLMKGDLSSYLHILKHPRLHLLSRLPLKLGHPRGDLKTHLGIKLPLDSRVTMEQISFDIHADYHNLAVDTDWIGTVRKCTGSLDFDGSNLKMKGGAVLHDVPMEISLEDHLSFPMKRHANIQAWVDDIGLKNLGLPLPKNFFKGKMRLEADLRQQESQDKKISGDIELLLDMNKIALKSPFWTKRADQAASLKAYMTLEGNNIATIEDIKAEGPELSLEATTSLYAHQINGLDIHSYQLGRNKGKMRFKWPVKGDKNQPYYADISASLLDLTPFFEHKTALNPSEKFEKTAKKENEPYSEKLWLPKGDWDIHLSSQKILYQEDKFISHFMMNASWKGRKIDNFSATFQEPTFFKMSLKRNDEQKKTHSLKFYIENISILCRELLGYHRLEGGAVALEGVFSSKIPQDSAGFGVGLAPFQGALRLEKLNLLHPPSVLTAATFFAPLHWGEIGRDRFENIRLLFNMRVKDGKMEFVDGQIGNAILGGTFAGNIDMTRKNMAITGTVSPFYRINAAPGYLPKIGSYFAPEKGSGVMAATYSVEGNLKKPKISVNPFAFFLPGILREMVH